MCFVQYTSAVSRFFVQHSAGGSQQLGCSCCCCCGRPCKWLLLLLLLLRPPLGQHCCTPACRSVPAGRSMVVTVGDVYCQVLYCVQALAWFPVAVDVHSHLPPCTMVLSEPRCPLRGVQSCPGLRNCNSALCPCWPSRQVVQCTYQILVLFCRACISLT